MQYYAEIIITPKELSGKDILNRDILICKGETALLAGIIFSTEDEPVEGALILVRSVGCNMELLKTLGYVITNETGSFAFVVKKQMGINYLLEVYEPITNCCEEDTNAH